MAGNSVGTAAASGTGSKTYCITQASTPTATPLELKADRAVTDPQSGRTSFYQGEDLVGSFVNINFHLKTA